MNKSMLVTRPKHDITTYYFFHWSEEIMKLAKSKSVSVLDLSQKRANKKEFESILNKVQPLLVFLNGHGTDKCVAGDNDEVLLEAGKNEYLVKSKIVYARSCCSGKILGPKSIKAGALAYLGYNYDFIFFRDEEQTRKPLSDNTAKLFLEPSNQIMISLLKGHSAQDADKRSKNLFRKNIEEVAISESPNNYLIPFLLWDMKYQVCLGNKKAAFC